MKETTKRTVFVGSFVILALAGGLIWLYAWAIEGCFFGIIGDTCKIYELPN